VYYYGANSCFDADLITALSSIIDARSADVISDSWGETISSSTGNLPASVIAEYSQLFEQAALEGIEVTFSAGDCGDEDPATSCGTSDTSTQPQADFPSSDPWVTSVGGTAIEIGKYGNVTRTVPWGDDAWLQSGTGWESLGWVYGGGGGTSGPAAGSDFAGFAQPAYQKGVVPASLSETLPTGAKSGHPMRVTPDVSMDADPWTGFLEGYTQTLPDGSTGYAENDIGGTSLASPLFAGLVADGIQARILRHGFQNPTLYLDYALTHGHAFHNVVTPSSAASSPVEILAAYGGVPAIAVQLGDDQALVGTPGYSDAGGVGTPGGIYPGF
jgi:subtilase family serine protease